MDPLVAFAAGYVACLVTLVPVALFAFLLRPWLRAFLSGSSTSLVMLLGARLRGSPVDLLLDAQLAMVQRGQPVPFHEVERTYIAHRHRITGLAELIDLIEQQQAAEAKAP